MTSRHQSVDEVFEAALDREPGDRSAYLKSCCPGDPALRHEVEDLIASHESAPDDFLERPAVELIAGGHLLSGNLYGREPQPIDLPPAPPRFAPGHSISGRFVIIRFIARGGMGEVYEADDQLLGGEHVALKVILPHIAADPQLAARFEQEVRLARNLAHRNLCPIYDLAQCADIDPPFLFLTMKLLSGETLADRLRALEPPEAHAPAERLPLGEAAEIFRQLVAGTAAIHAANVVHGDIKPNNIMLSGAGPTIRVHIMDFGLARLHDTGATQATRSVVGGALGYLAPEILRGARPSPPSDLYALGIVLHKILTGELPDPAGTSPGATFAKLAVADAPPALIHFVRELLADDTARRETAFAEMKLYFGLQDGALGDPGAARRQGVWTPPKPVHPILTRRRVLFAAGAAAACAATGTLAWNRDLVDDLLHPLPRKRFVSLIGWPPTKDAHLKPMLMGLIELIGNELARAEAFDHDLYVVPHVSAAEITTPAQINQIREAAGTNLVLAASGTGSGDNVRLRLSVLDSNPDRVLRTKQLHIAADQQSSLFPAIVSAATELLDVHQYRPDRKRINSGGTQNPRALAAYQEGEALAKLQNDSGLEQSLARYRTAVELDPHFALAYATLAEAYARFYELHRDPGAISLARANAKAAQKAAPDLAETHLAAAAVLFTVGDLQGAVRETSRAVSLDTENTVALVDHAQMLQACNQWTAAEDFFGRALAARPNNRLAHAQLGVLYSQEGRYKDALVEFRTALLASGSNADTLNNLADTYLRLGDIDNAKAYAQKSVATNPNPWAPWTMAAIRRSQGDYRGAVEAAREAIKMDPTFSAFWLELGDALGGLGNRTEALAAYHQMLKVQQNALIDNPFDGPGWMLSSIARAKTRDRESSVGDLKKAEEHFSGDMDSQLLRVRIFELNGMRQEAIKALENCFRRGATRFQLNTLPDLAMLRSDSRYRAVLTGSHA